MRPVRLLLSALVTVAVAATLPAVAQPSPEPPDSLVIEGISVNPDDGTFYRFHLNRDGMVQIDDLGEVLSPESPLAGVPEIPDSVTASLTLPASALELINEQVSVASIDTLPDRTLGVAIDRERLRLQFDQGLPIWFAVLSALGLLAIGGGLAAWRSEQREKARLRDEAATRQRALFARESERSRLAREIHDGPLQDIHALRLLTGAGAAEVVGDEAGRIARELRAIAEGLRPPALGRFGLAAALSAHASRVRERHPALTVGLDLDEDRPDTLPDLVRSALFRIAQESITNAVEHGGADAVHIGLRLPSPETPALSLDIADDGRGMPWDHAPDLAALADDGHYGLVGMHERASAIGGRLAFDGQGIGGRGARVHVEVPVSADADRLSLPIHSV